MVHEDSHSLDLMKLNVFYKDARQSNKMAVKLTSLRERIGEFKSVFSGFFRHPLDGFVRLHYFCHPKLVNDKKLQYSFDHSDDFDLMIDNYPPKHSIAVYTSIFGGYDSLADPIYVSDYCDYYAITDQEIPPGSVWKKVDTSGIPCFDTMDNYHKSKYCKMFPHILFPDYQYSIWIDGNVQIVADVMPLIKKMGSQLMATFENPKHDCIYTEAKYNIYHNNVNPKKMKQQMAEYKNEGFPRQFGMREFSVIVRLHHDKDIIRLMEQWWEQVNHYTMRDQISFPYILWKNDYSIDFIHSLGSNWRWSPRFIVKPHHYHIVNGK